jgi:glycoside/pentoside/hexuronide:cation symporter, GPH family
MQKNALPVSSKRRLAFAMGEIGDNVAAQTFSFLLFTFYYTVVKLPVTMISIAFIIWSIWNAINDPLIGFLSDRTKSKRGRRIVWMLAATIPLAILMVLLFTAPLSGGVSLQFAYLMIILIAYDTAYTAFNLNYNSLFSEMFITVEDRSQAGKIRGICVIIALILAFVLPSIVITDITNHQELPETPFQYIIVGVIAACIIITTYAIVLKHGAQERPEFKDAGESIPPFKEVLKFTFTNKAFLIYMIVAASIWICNGILPTIVPFFATYVLIVAEEDSTLIGLLLAACFVVAAFSMPLWTKIRERKGVRFTGFIALPIWAVTLFIFSFTTDLIMGFIGMLLVGIGLGGSIYMYDQGMAEIIDEDEILHGVRRSGAYYGIINFIIRLANILNFLMISLVFSGSAWENYTPHPGVDAIAGIKLLMGIYPAIVLVIGILGLVFYPIKGKRLAETQKKIEALHHTDEDKKVIKTDVG